MKKRRAKRVTRKRTTRRKVGAKNALSVAFRR